MRKVTALFLLVEGLDFITTYIGLRMGLAEMNPLLPYLGWGWLIFIKLFTVLLVAIVLQKKKETKWDIFIPAFLFLLLIWNIINLILL
jgi:hypothetical protein